MAQNSISHGIFYRVPESPGGEILEILEILGILEILENLEILEQTKV
jgi:hypothetical protein